MSSAVQLKLLTLLNVSAIKRPFDLDVPGGHRSSPTLSRETSLTPQQPAITTTTTTSTSNAGSSNSRGTDGEPPKKKKKGVIFGGVIGPSGSTIKSGEAGSASGSGSAEKKGKKNKDKKRVTSSNPADEVSESLTAETSTLTSTSAPFELEAEESSDEDEDDDTPTSSASTSKTSPISTADAFQTHFAITPLILDDETREAAEAHQWTSRRRVFPGLGRVVDCLPKGQEEGQVQSSGSSRVSRVESSRVPSFFINRVITSPAMLIHLTSTGMVVDHAFPLDTVQSAPPEPVRHAKLGLAGSGRVQGRLPARSG